MISDDILPTSSPLEIFKQLTQQKFTGCYYCHQNTVYWRLYWSEGMLLYATHSVGVSDRLERHLRRVCTEFPELSFTDCKANLPLLETLSEQLNDYLILENLIQEKSLSIPAAKKIIESLNQEVLEFLFVLDRINLKEILNLPNIMILEPFKAMNIVRYCRQRLRLWQSLGSSGIYSPYQRLYFFDNYYIQTHFYRLKKENPELILNGLSFYHLAALTNKDELVIARRLSPVIQNKGILLENPEPPFDRLPLLCQPVPEHKEK